MNTPKLEPASDSTESINHTEHALAALWAEVLELKAPPNANENFFSLGGDSMAMVTLEFRIQEDLSVPLSPGTLLRTPTLGELSRVVDSLLDAANATRGSGSPASKDWPESPHRSRKP